MQGYLPWLLCAVLSILLIIVMFKMHLLHRNLENICKELENRISGDTNQLIQIMGSDPYVRQLASGLNAQLKILRRERQRFQHGDLELKEAVTNVSHDLRTPLTAICGYLDMLEMEVQSEQTRRYLCQIQSSTEIMRQLLEELFRYSVVTSVQQLEMHRIDLRKSLEECLIAFEGEMNRKNIVPDIEIPDHHIEKNLDKAAVNRIFHNIISNALKYSDGDFKVQMDENGTIIFSNMAEKLSPVMAERLFERFYTVETGRKSTGLGLAIAKLLTENMGGTITAKYKSKRLFIILSFANDSIYCDSKRSEL